MKDFFATLTTGALLGVELDDSTSPAAQDSQPICERHPDSLPDASRITKPSNASLIRSARCKTTPAGKTLVGIRFGGVLHSHFVCRRFAEAHT